MLSRHKHDCDSRIGDDEYYDDLHFISSGIQTSVKATEMMNLLRGERLETVVSDKNSEGDVVNGSHLLQMCLEEVCRKIRFIKTVPVLQWFRKQ